MGQTQQVTITQICDVCSASKTFSQVQGEQVNPEQLAVMDGWYQLVKNHVMGANLAPIAKLVCSNVCAITLLQNNGLDLPTAPVPGKVLDFSKVSKGMN